ncbi:MAG: hypothetical protein QNJ81_11440 [Acidimicrobiia bacterium]|nr:hypothetical protein [Acidimicrobiia bacterium]
MTSVGRFAAGLLLGVLISGGLGLMLAGGDPVASTTTTTTTAAPQPADDPWFEAGEVMIGATALLPRELEVEDGVAFFDYDLTGLGPTLASDVEQRPDLATPQGDNMVMPELWELTTTSGQIVMATTGPFDSSVSFELPSDEAEVAEISLTGWRVAVPFGERVELEIEEGATAEIRIGTVTIETVLEQSISTIVQIDFADNGGLWDSNAVLRPLDSTWRLSGRQGGGLQLIWKGEDAPETVLLEDTGFEMRPTTGAIVVYSGDEL